MSVDTIQLLSTPQRAFLVVFQAGDEAASSLLEFAKNHRLETARLTGIGGFSGVTLGSFDPQKKEYESIVVAEQVEVVSLLGNVTMHDGALHVHAHMMVIRSDGTARSGQLLEGRVHPRLEIVVEEFLIPVYRSFDETRRLPLSDLDAFRTASDRGRS